MTDYVRRAVAELIGAVKHGAVYVGRTPDGYDGATKDDVVEFAGQIADLLDGGYVLVKADGLNHGDELEPMADPECDACGGDGWVDDVEVGGSLDCYDCWPTFRVRRPVGVATTEGEN